MLALRMSNPAGTHARDSLPQQNTVCGAQVSAYAAERKLQLIGVYHASERLNDAALSPIAARIAEKLQQRCCPQSAVFIVCLPILCSVLFCLMCSVCCRSSADGKATGGRCCV